MQTIVISVQTRDVDLAAREPLVITINEGVRDLPRASETNGAGASNEVAIAILDLVYRKPATQCSRSIPPGVKLHYDFGFSSLRKHASVWGVLCFI